VAFDFCNLGPSPAELLLTGITGVSLLGGGLLAWRSLGHSAAVSHAAAKPVEFEATALKLDAEAAAILKLVQSYIQAGDAYSVSLAQASNSLPTIASREEVGIIVKFLISANARMQQEAAELKSNLEQSRAQIEKLHSTLAEAQEMGMRDALTALSNRRGFDESLAREITDARNSGTSLCLVLGDLDNFKQVNDAFGHLVGDEILKMFAGVLTECVQSFDTVARFGGEEFAVILPKTRLDAALDLTERMRRQLEAKELVLNESGEKIGKVTASFGIAQLGEQDDAERLIQRADENLYEAKCAGRNRVIADATIAA
jgi:diguanylate cyclase